MGIGVSELKELTIGLFLEIVEDFYNFENDSGTKKATQEDYDNFLI